MKQSLRSESSFLKCVARGAQMFFLLAIFLASFLTLLSQSYAADASLFLSPSTGVYTVGGTFSVRILVNTGGEKINAAEGNLSFNKSDLSVVGISQANSIFNLWTVEPSFSNADGTITFGGGSPKGFSGNSGQIITVTFKALRDASSKVSFTSGVILAADGQGTNIISSMNGGAYTLQAASSAPKAEYVAPANTPDLPAVVSSTHGDINKWYTVRNASLSWAVPSDVTALRTLVDQKPYTIPTVFYEPPVKEKVIENLEDGTWYFHIQFRNKNGWGKVLHFRIQVDATKPYRFDIKEQQRDASDPAAKFLFDSNDETSSVAFYEVQLDDKEPIIWKDDGSHIFEANAGPGKHTIIVKATDGAGNFVVNTANFTVTRLDAPQFTDYAQELNSGVILAVRGTTYPSATVKLYVIKDRGAERSFDVEADPNGIFTLVLPEKTTEGAYEISAEAVDGRGAKSERSKAISVVIRQSDAMRIGIFARDVLSIAIPLLGLLILLVFMLFWSRHKFASMRSKITKEVKESEIALHKAFTVLRTEASQSIKVLERVKGKRALTEEENDIMENLKKNITLAEKSVEKEIADIEKLLK